MHPAQPAADKAFTKNIDININIWAVVPVMQSTKWAVQHVRKYRMLAYVRLADMMPL